MLVLDNSLGIDYEHHFIEPEHYFARSHIGDQREVSYFVLIHSRTAQLLYSR